MYKQLNSFFCGPAAAAAAIHSLGGNVGQQSIARLAGTTDEGTDEDGLKRALLARGYVPEECRLRTQLGAKNWLFVKLKLGYPVIICLGQDHWNHWTTAIGMLGNRVILFDPARFEYMVNTGVRVYSWERFHKRWFANKKTRQGSSPYYGLAVMPALEE